MGLLQKAFDITARVNRVIATPAEWSVMMLPPPIGIPAGVVLTLPRLPVAAIGGAIRIAAKAVHRPVDTGLWFD